MTVNQIMLVAWLAAAASRIPRILERWSSPFLSGPGWFFGIRVPSGFLTGAGGAILARYRVRLFLPWMLELPIAAALIFMHRPLAISPLIVVIALITRLNYYAARQAAENEARAFEIPTVIPPAAAVMLSLHPRKLRDYTNPWTEAVIGFALAGSLAYSAHGYVPGSPMRGPLMVTLVSIYFQIGLLLMKRGFVRARSAAPAGQAEKYLVWRESLRRHSTAVCDNLRLGLTGIPLIAGLASAIDPWQGSGARRATLIFGLTFVCGLGWHEWRNRQEHLKCARAMFKDRGAPSLVVRPDTLEPVGLLCFKSSLPMLLLKGPEGYALNLASPAVKTGCGYIAGLAVLSICFRFAL